MTDQAKSTFTIKSFTASYDIVEDRLRLDAIDGRGSKQSIFMTRPLTDKLIPVLVSHVEARTTDNVPKELLHSMQQLSSRLERRSADPTPMVKVEGQTPRWLCKTIRFKKTEKDLAIIFTDDVSLNAVVSMTESNVRATLDILNDLYAKSGWPAHAIPEWLKSDAAEETAVVERSRIN